ncbi:MAG: sugar phosphate nucleotidyltransferase, partial [Candidatus Gracilibacteria bacterium]|nr:sugar phosphate nucleotidyltransferase [Candidatus Gracilibacteria bacterium]
MMKNPTALILAGGFATRLWPLTEKRAKPLLPLAGKSLIRHILDKIPTDMRVIISTNRAFEEDFTALQKDLPDQQIEVFIEDSANDNSKVGALAATALVIERFEISTPLLLIAGDNYFGFELVDFLKSYEGKTLLASYDTKSLEMARQFGVLSVEGKRMTSFVEKPHDPPSTLISTGCYLFSPDHLSAIVEYSRTAADNLGGIFEYLLQLGEEVEVFSFEEMWIDIGSFESYLSAHRSLMRQNQIDPSSRVTNSHLGAAVDIAANCEIDNCEMDEVIVMEGCVIRNAR